MTSSDPESSTAYTKFIVLSGPRTGSTLLVDALNSSPDIVCFGEIFNQRLSIEYEVDGYDTTNSEDLALRLSSPGDFLSRRVFNAHPEAVRAVGFKFHYSHNWGFPGIRQLLEEDKDILVLHLQRSNLLRVLVSLKIAEETGTYFQRGGRRARISATFTRLLQQVLPAAAHPTNVRVTIRPDEFKQSVLENTLTVQHWEKIFAGHQIHSIYYEDMTADAQKEFALAQVFLGVTPSKLTIGLVRQNPQKLEELIENYTELRNAFLGSASEWMFSD